MMGNNTFYQKINGTLLAGSLELELAPLGSGNFGVHSPLGFESRVFLRSLPTTAINFCSQWVTIGSVR